MFRTLIFYSIFLFFPFFCCAQASTFNKLPKIYALVIGVTPQQSLSGEALLYPQTDAAAFKAFLKSPHAGSISESQITTLIGSNATRRNILYALDNLSSVAGKEDLVIFYFSGHGKGGTVEDEGYLVPFDFDKLYPNASGIPMELIAKKMSVCRAKMKEVYIDACHAGMFPLERTLKGDGGMENNKIATAFRSSFANFNSSGFIAMLSSKGNEESREDPVLGQGIFTHFLLKGLAGEADVEKNGLVNAVELESYVDSKVREYTRGGQHPVVLGNYRPDFPMSVVRLNYELRGLIRKNSGILQALSAEQPKVPPLKIMSEKLCRDDWYNYGMANFTNNTQRTLTIYKLVTRGTENALGTCDCFDQQWQLKIAPGKTVKAPARIKISWHGRDKKFTEYLVYFSTPGKEGPLYARLQMAFQTCKDVNFELNEDDFDFVKVLL